MDRGTKDEGFVSHALKIAEHSDGRWIANQAVFEGKGDAPLDPTAKAGIVTAVAIYREKYKWPESDLAAAHAVKTGNDARALIDRLSTKIPAADK